MSATPTPPPTTFASELIRARNEIGVSQARLAEMSGVSRSAIKTYETGRSLPGGRELHALCVALRVSPTRLLFGTDTPEELKPWSEAEDGGSQAPRMAAVRLHAVARMLARDEVAALYELARGLAVARHRVEAVDTSIRSAEFADPMHRAIQDEAFQLAHKGKPVNVEALVEAVHSYVDALAALSKHPE